ncbi:MAG: SMP-30/gluconolactonase/LRE family protein [Chloroflexi bacterium]|nr:SMP-30/gluconolactonase/LRE family protein [Chloroflexota bacterium]
MDEGGVGLEPQEVVEGGGEKKERRGSRRRIALLSLLVVLILATTAILVLYLLTRSPIQNLLPSAAALTKNIPPRYQFSIYKVSSPLGVAVSPAGDRVYATEGTGERQIVVFDRSGKEIRRFAPPNSKAVDRFPVYVATWKDKVYVTDTLRHSVDIYDPDGRYLGAVPPPDGARAWSPLGIGFDKGGRMLVTDVTKGSHRLFVFDPQGKKVLNFGSEGENQGQFSFPNGAVADDKGRFYVSDGNNGRVQVFDASGKFISLIGRGAEKGGLGLPRALTIDPEQRLYVVDTTEHSVAVYDVSDKPTYLFSIGSAGTGDGQFNYPNGVAYDPSGRVYVTDRENHRLQVWTY